MRVIILCGGLGTRLREETEYAPKPMIKIGDKPILWHIMKIYAHFGFKDFILALGYKGDLIRDYFLNYEFYNNDFTVTLGNHRKIEIQGNHPEVGWRVTLVETGEKAMTGARIKRCEKFINEDHFMVTYGDGVANIDIQNLVKYHISSGKIGTLIGVCPPSRFGELIIQNNKVLKFTEKPKLRGLRGYINGGFYVFKKEFFNFLWEEDDCVLELKPIQEIANKGELIYYKHEGFWQCMDTYRDFLYLNDLWNEDKAEWKVWT